MDDIENEQNGEKEQKLVTSRSMIPMVFPPGSLNRLLATSSAIQRLFAENDQVFRRFSSIIEAQAKLSDFGKLPIFPVAFQEMDSVSKSIERLLSLETSQINKIFESAVYQSEEWKKQQFAIPKIANVLQQNDAIWQSHFLEISKFAALSQASLARIPWDQVGRVIELSSKMQSTIIKSFGNFSAAYFKLFDKLESEPTSILTFPPTLSRLPAVEFYNGVSVIDSISVAHETNIEFERENALIIDETREETDDRLVHLLNKLNPELIVLLQGARLSLTSTNPDRVRHFATSLRELFTHVLHTLAPDHEINLWSTSPKHFDNGKPTRRARLLYVCRALNQNVFSEFVEKDIVSLLAFLQLFQQGTHEVTTQFSDLQLRMMLLRMESAILFLLEIWVSNR